MKMIALALLLAAPAAQATIADFTYSLELDLQGLDTQQAPSLKGYAISFDGFQVDVARHCQIVVEKKRMNCSGKGTVYPGLDKVGFYLRIPAPLTAIGNLDYRFEEQSSKTSIPLSLGEKKSLHTDLAWEENATSPEIHVAAAAPTEEPADAPIPVEADAIVRAGKKSAKPIAKKPAAIKAVRQ
jgi:hypothetical protein